MKKLDTPKLFTPLALTVSVLLVGIIVTKLSQVLTWYAVWTGVVLTLVTFLVMLALVLSFTRNRHNAELEHVLSRLKDVVPPISFPWLYSDEDLAKAGSKAKGNSIWILSPDLANIADKPIIIDAVTKNIKRRITYTYIVP